jgi:hypothetical protein
MCLKDGGKSVSCKKEKEERWGGGVNECKLVTQGGGGQRFTDDPK